MLKYASVGLLLASLLSGAAATAQEGQFPSRPITVVVGSSSGSSMEFEMRILSEKFKELTGQPILIDIRPGANGATGASFVMRAKPDGYTLFTSPASPMVFNPLTHKNLNYDPKKMTPIIEIGAQPLVLATRGDLPVNSVADLIGYAKGKPGGVFYSSTGIGGGNHMSALLFERYSGTQLKHVPYEGAGPATQAILRGEVDFGILSIASLLPWYRDGKIKILAVGSQARSPDAPDVPTFRELGYPEEFVLTGWRVLVGPPNMPDAVVDRLNGLVNMAYQDKIVRDRFKALGLDATGGTQAQVAAMLKREAATWEQVARENGIEPQ
ncbi:MAG: tctC [Hyphomicrobiales bacterium]|nr:tctC [Hyphomicrobiales bacterium]